MTADPSAAALIAAVAAGGWDALAEQWAVLLDEARCPVTCSFHTMAKTWARDRMVATIADYWPEIETMQARAWKPCTCRMYERLQQIREETPP